VFGSVGVVFVSVVAVVVAVVGTVVVVVFGRVGNGKFVDFADNVSFGVCILVENAVSVAGGNMFFSVVTGFVAVGSVFGHGVGTEDVSLVYSVCRKVC
jgi:hypothetical protein